MTNETVKKRIVTDEFNQQFELVEKLGQGGQGIVCTTQFEGVLVKMNTQTGKDKKRKWAEHIRWLMRQPLETLNIAKPFSRIAMNSNNVGYAMELMDGLMPLQKFMDDTEEAIETSGGSSEHYLASGGIKRRLRILAKLARTLAGLHAKGMAYGDLSPANIFISEQVAYSEVWLIDCDNICINQRDSYDSLLNEGKAGKVFSPGYGAPEVVNGESFVSSLTDSWSFAVVAMKLLTTNHPFVGDLVENGTPEDQDNAYAGHLPWIYHPTDASNEISKGVPLDLVALKPLKALFERCFNAGKATPSKRPSLSEWAETFEKVSNILVNCQNNHCNASFNFVLEEHKLICPFCDSELNNSQVLYFRHYLYDKSILDIPDAKPDDAFIDTGYRQTLNIGESIVIKDSPPGSVYWAESTEKLSIHLNEKGLEITPMAGHSFEMGLMNSSKLQKFNSPTTLALETKKNKNLVIKPIGTQLEPQIDSHFGFRW
jgi:DNA-binding helix-hairpin-helix protein with protein kinase domain